MLANNFSPWVSFAERLFLSTISFVHLVAPIQSMHTLLPFSNTASNQQHKLNFFVCLFNPSICLGKAYYL